MATVPITPTAPDLPDPPAQYDKQYHTQVNNVLRLFFNSVTTGVRFLLLTQVGGSVTFAASATATVTFTTVQPNALYHIALGGNAAGYCWYTNKATTGFTVNCSAANSNTTDWTIT